MKDLLRRYSAGVVGAVVGCHVTYEGDRSAAVTTVLRAILEKYFDDELSVEEVMRMAWSYVLE